MVLSHHTSFVKRKMVSNVVQLRIYGDGFTTSGKARWWESSWLVDFRIELYDTVKRNRLVFSAISFVVTLLVMFLDAIRLLCFPPSADGPIDAVILCLLLYVLGEFIFGR